MTDSTVAHVHLVTQAVRGNLTKIEGVRGKNFDIFTLNDATMVELVQLQPLDLVGSSWVFMNVCICLCTVLLIACITLCVMIMKGKHGMNKIYYLILPS